MNKQTRRPFIPKDPGSAITHFIGMLMAVFAAFPLLFKAARQPEPVYVISLAVFIFSMALLYAASTIYHTFDCSPKVNRLLKKLDHMMIFVMIAGSYTPICLIVINGTLGKRLLIAIWSMALAGIIFKFFWVTCPKWVSSVIYVMMGWTCVFAFTPLLHRLSLPAFLWLLLGGIIYTLGGIIYALKLPVFNNRFPHFGSHEIFHLFVMAGSICHFIVMYQYVTVFPI